MNSSSRSLAGLGLEPSLEAEILRLAEAIGAVLREELTFLGLHGSAVEPALFHSHSDVNLVLVARFLDPTRIDALSGAIGSWISAHDLSLRMLEEDGLRRDLKIFPGELWAVRRGCVTLSGTPWPSPGPTDPGALRAEAARGLRRLVESLHHGRVNLNLRPDLLVREVSRWSASLRHWTRLVGFAEAPPETEDPPPDDILARASGFDADLLRPPPLDRGDPGGIRDRQRQLARAAELLLERILPRSLSE